MKLSNGEKLSLLMLSEIYKHLKIKGEIEPEFVEAAILDGQEWALAWKYSGIPFENEEAPQAVSEVSHIMSMWSMLKTSYEKLTPAEQAEIDAERMAPPKMSFPGFDGNNETEHMAIAQFLVKKLERFEDLSGHSFNSHMPMLDAYDRMMSAYDPIIKSFGVAGSYLLSKNQILDVLKERIHPERR